MSDFSGSGYSGDTGDRGDVTGKPEPLCPGESYSFDRKITGEAIYKFAELSGDFNDIHMNDAFCMEHGTGGRIAHGMLALSYVSALIGMHLPGNGAVWLSQSFDFLRPVRIGDVLTISGRVAEVNRQNMLGKAIYTIEITVKNQKKEVVIRGRTKVTVK